MLFKNYGKLFSFKCGKQKQAQCILCSKSLKNIIYVWFMEADVAKK